MTQVVMHFMFGAIKAYSAPLLINDDNEDKLKLTQE